MGNLEGWKFPFGFFSKKKEKRKKITNSKYCIIMVERRKKIHFIYIYTYKIREMKIICQTAQALSIDKDTCEFHRENFLRNK